MWISAARAAARWGPLCDRAVTPSPWVRATTVTQCVQVDCCRSCDAAKRVQVDSQMLMVQVEEALANARKYALASARIQLSARIQHQHGDDINEIGEDGEIGEIGLETSLTTQPAAKATHTTPKNGSSLAHSAPLLGSASLAKVPAATPPYYRCSS